MSRALAKVNYSIDERSLAMYSKAMGHPVRIQILKFVEHTDMLLYGRTFRYHPSCTVHDFSAFESIERCWFDTGSDLTSKGIVLFEQRQMGRSSAAF